MTRGIYVSGALPGPRKSKAPELFVLDARKSALSSRILHVSTNTAESSDQTPATLRAVDLSHALPPQRGR